MADALYLSLWFPSFRADEMLARTTAVLRQFPFSPQRPGITQVEVHGIAWNDAIPFENAYDPGLVPEEAAELLREFAHPDYGFVLEAWWDLWAPRSEDEGGAPDDPSSRWVDRPVRVTFLAHGLEFDEGAAEEQGHIRVELGLDTPFLYEEEEHTPELEARVRANVHKLVNFTTALEKQAGVTSRLLWSDSEEENLAQKLISRLQRVQ